MKKKIPFDISYREKIESGEVELTTNDGRRVKILRWDVNSDKPIVAIIQSDIPDSDKESVVCYSIEGIQGKGVGPSDLAILVEKPRLTEFEQICEVMLLDWDEIMENAESNKYDDYIREKAAELLEDARKALRPEFDAELEKAYRNQDDVVYQRGYDAGFAAGSAIDEERLTDKIAEKVAERVVKDGNPFAPNPAIPGYQWTTPGRPYEPITVMYGVTPTEFRPITGDPSPGAIWTESSATTEKYNETEE